MYFHELRIFHLGLKKKSLMSRVMNLAPLAESENTLFRRSFVSIKEAAGEVESKS